MFIHNKQLFHPELFIYNSTSSDSALKRGNKPKVYSSNKRYKSPSKVSIVDFTREAYFKPDFYSIIQIISIIQNQLRIKQEV